MKIVNRTAHYNYQIHETLEAGIDLLGPEVKSIREGKVDLGESFVHLRDGQAWLVNAHVHPYQNSATMFSPTRARKLLLHKQELLSLKTRIDSDNLTLVPLAIYNKRGIFKLELGIGKGKKKWDKREDQKKKDQQREIEIELREKG